jgi:hypothetical protein
MKNGRRSYVKEIRMVDKLSLRRLLQQLHRRRADVQNLISFFEKYGKNQSSRRRVRPRRYLRATS